MICLLLYMICLLLFMILSHRIFLAIMCDNHAMKKVLINLLFLRMSILLMIISLLLDILVLDCQAIITYRLNLYGAVSRN